MIQQYKVAYYNDEAGADLASSKTIGQELDLKYVILRNINNRNILKIDDNILSEWKRNHLEIVGLHTDISLKEAITNEDLTRLHKKIYLLKPHLVRFGWNGEYDNHNTVSAIIDLSISLNFVPIIEYEHEHFKSPKFVNVDKWFALLEKSRRLKILFDPTQYVLRTKSDPVERIFLPLYHYVGMIDVRDHLIGVAPQIVGSGSIDWKTIFKKLDSDKYNGWLCLEPGLGMRYRDTNGRGEVFKLAYEAFTEGLNYVNKC